MRLPILIAALAAAAPAYAVPTKATGFKAALPGTTAAKQPELAGTVVSDVLTPFTLSSTFPGKAATTGKVQVRSVRGKDGTLTYYWRILVDAGGSVPVRQLFIEGFPAAVYDANWRIDGLGNSAPSSINGFVFNDLGHMLVFEFDKPVESGGSSRFMFLKTKSTASKPAEAYVGGGSTGHGIPFKIIAPAN